MSPTDGWHLPAGSWDCHAHIIGDPARYTLAPDRSYDPRPAPLEAYLALLDDIGVDRAFLVQPSVYGFDNRCMLDALERADGRLLGVAVPAPDTTERELEALHRRGVRGVRCNILNPGGLAVEAALRWRPVLRELGWHVALQISVHDTRRDGDGSARQSGSDGGDARAAPRDLVSRFDDVPVVIDHMGRPAAGRADPEDPHVRRLVTLVREGACFVKLSAPYRASAQPPPWRDIDPLARALVAANAGACLWATDWPHTDTAADVPRAALFDALARWCRDTNDLHAVTTGADARLDGRRVRTRTSRSRSTDR